MHRMDIKNTLLQIQAKGMTQAQIATAMDCGQSTVSELMSEKIGKVRPSHRIVEAVRKLAKKVGVTPNDSSKTNHSTQPQHPKHLTRPRQQDPDHQKTNRTHPTEQQVRETESAGGRSASNKEAA